MTTLLDTVTDFLIELGMKPFDMHLVKRSIFSLNNVTDRLNKIMDNLLEDFQNHFSVLQIGLIFPKLIFCEEYWARRPTFKDRSEITFISDRSLFNFFFENLDF